MSTLFEPSVTNDCSMTFIRLRPGAQWATGFTTRCCQPSKPQGFTPHQMRRFFGDELKQAEVSKEFRADLLVHGEESKTT